MPSSTAAFDLRDVDHSPSVGAIALFCLLAGITATFARGYTYGLAGHADLLPLVFRELDPDYLRGDFFVNTATEAVGPRTWTARFLAGLGRIAPLPAVFLVLMILSKASLAAVTIVAAWSMFRSALAGMFAASLVLAIDGIDAGGAARLTDTTLVSSLVARPFALASLWCALGGRLVWASLAAAAAIALHPLVGFETAAVGLAAAGATALAGPGWPDGRSRTVRLAAVCAAMAAMLAAAWLFFGREMEKTLSTSEFIHILAYVRAPHHYLPSTFGPREHAMSGVFMAVTGVAWRWWKREGNADPRWVWGVMAAAFVVLAGLVAGYVFVEIVPCRLAVTAQTFRMLSVIKWLGYLLLAAAAARLLVRPPSADGWLPGWILLMGTGLFQPLAALIGESLAAGERWLKDHFGEPAFRLAAGLALIGIASFAAHADPDEAQALAVLLVLGFCCLVPRSAIWRLVTAGMVIVAAVYIVASHNREIYLPRLSRPVLTLADSTDPLAEAAVYARRHTPPEAVFLTPPDGGGFRLLACRAVVVDWECLPLCDAGMAEWYRRVVACYGDRRSRGPLSYVAAEQFYRTIDDAHVTTIARTYGATHAVLHDSTRTRLPVLWQSGAFKIVLLNARLSERGRTPDRSARLTSTASRIACQEMLRPFGGSPRRAEGPM